MLTFFVTTSKTRPDSWLEAFPDARIITNDSFLTMQLDEDSVVWVLLAGNWQNAMKHALESGALVIAMSLNNEVRQARSLLSVGVKGYVNALSDAEQLKKVQDVVVSGSAWLGVDLLKQLLVNVDQKEEAPVTETKPLALLTDRENAVAACIAAGKSNKEVAKELNITERTVKAHLSSCFQKLNVRDRVQLALVLNK